MRIVNDPFILAYDDMSFIFLLSVYFGKADILIPVFSEK